MRISAKTQVLTYGALVALSGLTYALSFASLGPWSMVLALAIAAAKAALVFLFFMHLAEQRAVNAWVLVSSLLLVAFFVGLGAADVATRYEHDGAGAESATRPPR